MNKVYPVILSGGSGTRLWPLSRKHYPKQFLKLTGPYTMLQETALRLEGFERPIAVCNEAHRFTLADQLNEIGQRPTAILLEPVARNTAPAIALAALEATELSPDAILVVLPADHVIKDIGRFQQAAKQAVEAAREGTLVTFGITPDRPETGFGYIQAADTSGRLSDIKRFVEKPDAATAQEYLNSGDYCWNSGMFVFKASVYLDELKQYQPGMYQAVEKAFKRSARDLDFIRVEQAAFAESPDNSIDYAVMEHTRKGKVLPIDVGWNDVGSFAALWEVQEKDEHGNVNLGDVENIDSRNCLIQSENQFVATVGVENLVIIGTKDAVLVADKDRVQDVKAVVKRLKDANRSEHELHREVHRPWGQYDSIDNGQRYQVKRITVKPGEKLSVQMHHHRAEHWIVVSGTANVTIDQKEQLVTENESVYIPIGAVHALENPGKIPLELIEVQSGAYLGEDDIVRFSDRYGRVEQQ